MREEGQRRRKTTLCSVDGCCERWRRFGVVVGSIVVGSNGRLEFAVKDEEEEEESIFS